MPEVVEEFPCFGSSCSVRIGGPDGLAHEAALQAKRRLLAWHHQFSRFEPDSELSRLNADRRETVPVSATMALLADAVTAAAMLTGGLVDATLVGELEHAGYAGHFEGGGVPLAEALSLAPARRAAGASTEAAWQRVRVDHRAGTISRPPGVKLDSGGIAKGLFADVLAGELASFDSFAVDCGGDVRLGGAAGLAREVRVSSPIDDSILHVFELTDSGVATSGIGRRSWLDAQGRPAHHLLDPATGRPAFTGIVQVTALAATGVLAEALSKATLLSGPEHVERWLTRGGVVVYDDGRHRVLPPR